MFGLGLSLYWLLKRLRKKKKTFKSQILQSRLQKSYIINQYSTNLFTSNSTLIFTFPLIGNILKRLLTSDINRPESFGLDEWQPTVLHFHLFGSRLRLVPYLQNRLIGPTGLVILQ